ncbi:hypothetical protein DICPUDRAFT_43824 [Dictyostelium purpureum]|uniref:Uncharacterized protein n=1 Tax=Dictyostelium purpureum TaxID=5786 RepID=F1A4W0_DICPU|nr:uncharacterized protein DICPUDRAFT_43824 [Dictyostelium purpureum]EGC28769.1 hypothetical protein DICPUDRAFT_43824 [Dictyostelium purpureum]|eukprot:XP_003294704.1 hypothetical protein DICPUDRAFT_43824 [Dictyostelium purpureum]
MKTFFERDFTESIVNHIKDCFKNDINLKNNNIKKLLDFPKSLRIKHKYPALFFWYMVRECAIENKLNYLIITQQLIEILKNDDEKNKDENDKEKNYERYKKKSIKLLIKVYKSSIVNNTFIQKDIKIIQKFYLKHYQINPVDISIPQSITKQYNDETIKPPTQLIQVYNHFKKESILIKHNLADKQLFTREKVTKYETTHPLIDYNNYTDGSKLEKEIGYNKVGDWSITPSLELFKECFKVYSNNILDGIEWGNGEDKTKVIASGGSVTSCLSSLPKPLIKKYLELLNIYRVLSNHSGLPMDAAQLIFNYLKPYHSFYDDLFNHYHGGSSPYMKGDIDLFFIAPTIEEGKKKIEEVSKKIRENMISKKGLDFKFVRTQNSITIVSEYPYRPIQLMIFFIRSIEDLILFYDLDCSCTAYNGDNVYVLPRTINAFNKRLNMVPPSIFLEDNDRLYKYCLRGFNSICFENCVHKPRCDMDQDLYDNILTYIPTDAFSRPKFIVSSYNEASSIFHFPYGPETEFHEILEAIDIYSYRNSSYFKSSMLDPDPKKDIIQILPCEWRFKNIKVNALASNLKFKCYICKEPLEDTSTRVCPVCRYNNINKTNAFSYSDIPNAKAALNHKVAIVTGGRIKIGYEIAKHLLESGFKVIITTRFPASAYEQFKKNIQPDNFSNLYIYGVDFRNLQSVQQFIDTVKKEFSRIDILINNAAQTIRYPRAYYHNLLFNEKTIISSFDKLPPNILSKIENINMNTIKNNSNNNNNNNNNNDDNNGKELLLFNKNSKSSIDIVESVVTKDDEDEIDESLFPTGKMDLHGQQLDLRTKHTWNSTVEEITTAEMLEVQLINNTVPFMLINQLSSHMGLNKNDEEIISKMSNETKEKYLEAKNKMARPDWSVIVNVTSPEGNINHESNAMSGFHCHTNMAKASLNMLTKSIAYQFEKKNIYVIGCDTGWVSDMMPNSPIGIPSRPPPLKEIDGASRVLYPVYFHLFRNERHESGVQFVNFKPSEW